MRTESDAASVASRNPYTTVLITLGAMICAVLALAALGAVEAAQHRRVLSTLDVPVQCVRVWGEAARNWMVANRSRIGAATTALASSLALAGCVLRRWRALPLLLVGAAISLATWGQVVLFSDQITRGILLYASGVICAVVLGAGWPIAQWGTDGALDHGRRAGLPPWEGLVLFGLTLLALLTRLYALTELPKDFEAENAVSMLASRTLAGLRTYVPWALLANSNGLVHLFPQMASFKLLGTSVYSLRLVSVCFGVAAVPLLYWLVRRLGGTGPAVVAAALLIAAPEQLFWSRQENTPFAAVILAGLITVHLGLWMVERFSFWAMLAVALWMPVTRYFYLPAMAMMVYAPVLYGHALVFRGRAAWRRAWYALPLLAGGAVLWIFSLSFVRTYLNDWRWEFVPPAVSSGTTVWRGEGRFRDASVPELVRLQAFAIAKNLGTVAKNMTYETGFTGWYRRADMERHATITNVGLIVMVAVGLGYLLGQVYESHAFALLLWLGLGLLPGVMSLDPGPRRWGIAFPALYAVSGVLLGGLVRLIRDRAGAVLAYVTSAMLGIFVTAIVWTSLASHFLLPIGLTWAEAVIRSTAPLFERSSVIYHNLDPTLTFLLVFGNADRFVQPATTPGLRHVNPEEWLQIALRHPCNFTAPPYRFILSQGDVDGLRRKYNPRRIAFLLEDDAKNEPYMNLLQALYPHARVDKLPTDSDQRRGYWTLTVERSVVDGLRSPILTIGADMPDAAGIAPRVMDGARLTASTVEHQGQTMTAGITVRGGLLIQRDGWYRTGILPSCSDASVTLDGRHVTAADLQPMLAGVHAFEVRLPNAQACALPIQLHTEMVDEQAPIPLEAPLLLTPAVLDIPAAVADPVTIDHNGYGTPTAFPQSTGTPLDFGVDAEGALTLLYQEGPVARLRRVSADGRQTAAWEVPIPDGYGINGISVAPDGVSFVVFYSGSSPARVMVYDRAGTQLATWQDGSVATTAIGHLPDGRILSPLAGESTVALVGRNGTVEQRWAVFEGGPGKFHEPSAVGVGPNGELLVVQTNGLALVFHNSEGKFDPQFVRSFQVDFSEPSVHPRGWAFIGSDRAGLVDPSSGKILIYTLEGSRVMAADPARDLTSRRFGSAFKLQSAKNRLYVLAGDRHLWTVWPTTP